MTTCEPVDTENITQFDVFTQTKVNIVTEDGKITKGHNTPCHTAINSRDPLVGNQLKPDGVEYLLTSAIQLCQSFR